ncbi:hypothetical protein RclHR1_03130017 [Rhizophagus clarus]|uniref:BTB domain-containing protein n=1 Tax=Rhizophagus clarus TaxID=94130 RepID=A0A2Z6S158_9GLOM|nr:hypothetical protein RclHR1_03130017 [Rhizophagus clarus]GES81827.1 hypothetical protein GLOIN_2v1884981 [Rhizophagus clarus]
MVSKFHSNLSKDLSLILNDADDYNVIIQVGDNQNMKEFRAHSVILRARSSYFKGAFSTGWITNEDNMIMFKKPNITPIVFDMILTYIYTGELDLTIHLSDDILGLLVATDELLLEELFKHIQDYLIRKRSTWIQRNLVHVLHTVFKLVRCEKLRDYCLESICLDPQPFFTSKEFLSLDKDILYGLLKRNDLQIEEIIAWDYLIKWGIKQTRENNDIIKWNDKNYEDLKNILNQFIPLIRFIDISPADYFDKVRPYKMIIPNNINDEVEEFYYKGKIPKITAYPPRTGMILKVESKILKSKQFNIINNWINRKNSSVILNKNDLLYNFKLIYRKSRDGNEVIRNKCNDQGSVLILIKVKYSEEIFGGYNSIGWIKRNYRNKYLYTTESFIFLFEDNNDTKNMNISRVIVPSRAIYDCPGVISFGGGELELSYDNLSLSDSTYYEDGFIDDYLIEGEECTKYEVDDIEVFSVS